MKRKWLSVLLVGAMTLSLAACSGSSDSKKYECMEFISVAEGNYDNSGFTDNADADCESFGRLYDGLWGFNGRGSFLLYSYDDCFLHSPEAICRRYYRSCKIIDRVPA